MSDHPDVRLRVNAILDVGVPFLRSLNVEPFRINTTDLKYISRDFHQRLKKSALKPGDIVIVRTGKPGSCAVIPDWLLEANCSDVVVVRPGRKVRPGYISYVVNSTAAHHIDAHTVGAVQQHFNVASARQIRFWLPPIVEQDRILSILCALDDNIDLNRRMNETLEAMARAIFKDWFVEFGPTRAKMEGRAPYLAPDMWSLFPDRLDDDEKPEGWKLSALREVVHHIRETISPSSSPEELFDHYSIPAFDQGQDPVREAGSGILSNKTIVPADVILLSKLNPEISRVWLVDIDAGTRAICSTEFLVFSPRVPSDRALLYCLMTEGTFKQRLEGMVTGTSKSHQRVGPDAVLAIDLVIAPRQIMDAFPTLAAPMLNRILANRREVRTLSRTRDLLLPKLMSGEIRVKDAEKAAEAVL
jgi:type I restriction enzyme S subunit